MSVGADNSGTYWKQTQGEDRPVEQTHPEKVLICIELLDVFKDPLEKGLFQAENQKGSLL